MTIPVVRSNGQIIDPYRSSQYDRERWLSKMGFWYVPVTETGCWIWMRAVSQGYGHLVDHDTGSKRGAHCLAYEHLVGPIPPGLEINHICRQKACVNPGHLEAVTSKANTLWGPGPAYDRSRMTRCVRGHEFTPENTIIKWNGTRRCRICTNRYQTWRLRQRTWRVSGPSLVNWLDRGEHEEPPAEWSSLRDFAIALALDLRTCRGNKLKPSGDG